MIPALFTSTVSGPSDCAVAIAFGPVGLLAHVEVHVGARAADLGGDRRALVVEHVAEHHGGALLRRSGGPRRRPGPRPAPVTITTLPSNRPIVPPAECSMSVGCASRGGPYERCATACASGSTCPSTDRPSAATPCRGSPRGRRGDGLRRPLGERPRLPPGGADLPVALPARPADDPGLGRGRDRARGPRAPACSCSRCTSRSGRRRRWRASTVMSGGRLTIAVGVGWSGARVRGGRLVVRALGAPASTSASTSCATCWRDDPASFAGEHYAFRDIRVVPRPERPIPIWVGGRQRRRVPPGRREGRRLPPHRPHPGAGGDPRPPAAARPPRGRVHDLAAHRVGPPGHGPRRHPPRARRSSPPRASSTSCRAPWRTTADDWLRSMELLADLVGLTPRYAGVHLERA